MKTQILFDLPSLSSARRSTFGLLSALLLSLFLAGCGGDGGGGSFVATPDTGGAGGSGLPANQTGSVTFNFTQAQAAPIVVPTGTERLRFEFFTGPNGDGDVLLRETRDYAQTVTINGVPVRSRSAVVTAFGADGFPTSQFEADITVVAQQTITVGLTDGVTTPVTLDGITVAPLSLSLGDGDSVRLDVFALFSSGDRVQLNADHLAEATFVSTVPGVAVVDENFVSAAGTGATNVNITFRGQSVAVPVTVNLGPTAPPIASGLSVTPTSVSLPVGTVSAPLVLTASFDGGSTEVVTLDDGVTFFSDNTGVTVDSDQRIVISPSVTPGTTAQVRFTYLGQNVTVNVGVTTAIFQGLVVTPDPVSIPFGGFEQDLQILGRFSDNSVESLVPSDDLVLTPSGPFEVDVDGSTHLVRSLTTSSGGTGTLEISYTRDGQTYEEEISVEVGTRFVQQLEVVPATLSLNPGESRDVTVNARLDDNSVVDVSGFQSLNSSSDDASKVLANGRTVVGVSGPQAVVTFSMTGAGQSGAEVTGTLEVTVTEITLDSITLYYAGNEAAASVNTFNLPRGYVGIFEVEGNFSNGTSRRLRASEYTVTKTGGANNPDAIGEFRTGYTILPPDGRFFDGAPKTGTVANEVTEQSDDFIFRTGATGVRTTFDGERSNANQVALKPTFRGVAADWYRGPNQDVDNSVTTVEGTEDYRAGSVPAPNSSANIQIAVPGYPQFTRNVTVTITDPSGPPTNISVEFLNYPGDPNIARNTPRELEVRVDFPAAEIPYASVAFADAQTNFKLAEANVEFVTDNVANLNNVIHHRATEIGFVGVTSNVPLNSGLIYINAQPLGGPTVAPALETPAIFEITNSSYLAGTASDPAVYSAATYISDLSVFGQASGLTAVELPGLVATHDPGPSTVAGQSVLTAKAGRSPADAQSRIFFEFNNGGAGFRIVDPLRFTIESTTSTTSPFNLEVGESTIFRTLVQWASTPNPVSGLLVDDVSLDYPPVVDGGLTETEVVFGPFLPEGAEPTGAVVVSGVVVDGQATVTARDVANNPISPAGTNSLASMVVNVIAPVMTP